MDLEHLEKAEEKLKLMRKQRMHVAAGEGCLHQDTFFFLVGRSLQHSVVQVVWELVAVGWPTSYPYQLQIHPSR